MIVRVDGFFAALFTAEDFDGSVRYDLVYQETINTCASNQIAQFNLEDNTSLTFMLV
jgi:hypothetical protein